MVYYYFQPFLWVVWINNVPEWKIAAEISTNAHTNTAMTAADTTLTAENREQTEWRGKIVEQLARESTTMNQLFTSSLSHHGSDTTGCCDWSGKRKSYCLLYCSTELLLLMAYILCLFFYIAVRWFWCCDIFGIPAASLAKYKWSYLKSPVLYYYFRSCQC